jgi:threonine aldolase
MESVDLRSDTVTIPTPAMRKAMADAPVGDDVYGEDPTVNRLQEMAAERMGKEAGLFVASGTMGNLVATLAHCNRGDEAIMGNLGHTFVFEGGGVAALGGVVPHTLPNRPDGTLDLDEIRGAVRGDDPHFPTSRLIILENTHNRCGGVPLSAGYTQQVAEIARQNQLKLHLDGARIFNAAAALGTDAKALAAPADSVTFCLSKGLCAPVGSVLCGTKEFIYKARRIRKQVGGGMRQAGILAAAGIVALEQMTVRLAEDHARARRLADGLRDIPALVIEPAMPPSNMVFATLADATPGTAAEVAARLVEYGIKIGVAGPRRFRMVTHYWVDDGGLERAIQALHAVLAENKS